MFENETKVDLETNLRASRHIIRNKRIALCALSVFIILLGIAMLLLEIFVWKDGDYYVGIIFTILGIFLFFFNLFFNAVLRNTTKRALQGKESVVKYSFREEDYEAVTLVNDGTTSSTSGNYLSFLKICEYEDMWLIYFNKTTVFAVGKDGMTKGTSEELSEFLKTRVGAKYKVCYRRK